MIGVMAEHKRGSMSVITFGAPVRLEAICGWLPASSIEAMKRGPLQRLRFTPSYQRNCPLSESTSEDRLCLGITADDLPDLGL